jgi:hypothetical protein
VVADIMRRAQSYHTSIVISSQNSLCY